MITEEVLSEEYPEDHPIQKQIELQMWPDKAKGYSHAFRPPAYALASMAQMASLHCHTDMVLTPVHFAVYKDLRPFSAKL